MDNDGVEFVSYLKKEMQRRAAYVAIVPRLRTSLLLDWLTHTKRARRVKPDDDSGQQRESR
jgi:hypothetical protein